MGHAQNLINSRDAALYRQAFAALKDGSGQNALTFAAQAQDKSLYDVVYGLALGQEDSPVDFGAYEIYLNSHITWPEKPRRAMARMAEKKMPSGLPAQQVILFFQTNAPQTVTGLHHYATALQTTGAHAHAAKIIRDFWRDNTLDENEQNAFLPVFSKAITAADTAARADMLVWKGKYHMAEMLYGDLDGGYEKLIRARIALLKNDKKAPQHLAQVPRHLQNDSGLLYARMRWRRNLKNYGDAIDMIRRARGNLGHAKEWWDERQQLARDLLQNGETRKAYDLVAHHGTQEDIAYVEGEFLAGWIALRFLNQPKIALDHFARLTQKGETPITLSRGHYWQGRALEALNQTEQSRLAYQQAAHFGTSFYGQLAASRLFPASQLSATAPIIDNTMRAAFDTRPEMTIIARLIETGGHAIAEDFALALAKNFTTEGDFRLLADLALRLHDHDLAVKISKQAVRKKINMPVEGWPLLREAEGLNHAALAHAITRQESQMDPVVVSPSNAQGLMQLLPSTAREVARKMGMDSNYDIYDPSTNMQLGTFYITEMLERFDGSLPLAIASYNAGPGRISRLLPVMGDPRGGKMDMVDWIESLPISETRNYVMRVMENLQIYRAKLAGGTTRLTLVEDLR